MKKLLRSNPKKTNRFLFFKNFRKNISRWLIFSIIFFLPTQLGKHFFLSSSYVFGVRVDYLSPTIYFFDLLIFVFFLINFQSTINFLKQKSVLLFLFVLLINSLFSLFQLISLYKLIKMIEWLILFYLFKNEGKKYLKIINFGFLLSTVVQFCLVIAQLVKQGSIGSFLCWFGERTFSLSTPEIAKASFDGEEILRPYGTFSHPNSLAGFFLLIYFYFLLKKSSGWVKNIVLFLSSLLIIFSFSKIALFLLVVGNGIYQIRKNFSCRICFFSHLITLLTISLIFFFWQTDKNSFFNRILLVKEWWNLFSKNALFGIGLGAYVKGKELIDKSFIPYYLIVQPVHNVWLLLLAELGVVFSFIAFISIKKQLFFIIQKGLVFFLIIFISGYFDHYWWTLPQNFFLSAIIIALVLF